MDAYQLHVHVLWFDDTEVSDLDGGKYTGQLVANLANHSV